MYRQSETKALENKVRKQKGKEGKNLRERARRQINLSISECSMREEVELFQEGGETSW